MLCPPSVLTHFVSPFFVTSCDVRLNGNKPLELLPWCHGRSLRFSEEASVCSSSRSAGARGLTPVSGGPSSGSTPQGACPRRALGRGGFSRGCHSYGQHLASPPRRLSLEGCPRPQPVFVGFAYLLLSLLRNLNLRSFSPASQKGQRSVSTEVAGEPVVLAGGGGGPWV